MKFLPEDQWPRTESGRPFIDLTSDHADVPLALVSQNVLRSLIEAAQTVPFDVVKDSLMDELNEAKTMAQLIERTTDFLDLQSSVKRITQFFMETR